MIVIVILTVIDIITFSVFSYIFLLRFISIFATLIKMQFHYRTWRFNAIFKSKIEIGHPLLLMVMKAQFCLYCQTNTYSLGKYLFIT